MSARWLAALFFLAFVLACSASVNAVALGQCLNLSSANSVYVLNQSVSADATCFNVTADNVTVDCSGFTVNYSAVTAGYGVQSNSSNTTVKNCVLNQSNSTPSGVYGVYFNAAVNGTVYNNTITSFTVGQVGYGVFLSSGSNYSNVSGNNVTFVVNATAASASLAAIFLNFSSDYNNVSGNNFYFSNFTTAVGPGASSLLAAVYLSSSFNNSFSSNNITSSIYASGNSVYLAAVYLLSSFNNSFSSNNVTSGIYGGPGNGARLMAVFLSSSPNNYFSSNNISFTYKWSGGVVVVPGAILSYSSSGLFFSSNNVDCYYDCIYLSSSSNHTISGNNLVASTSSGWGFNLATVSYSNFFANNITTLGSNGYGIYASSSSDYNNFSSNVVSTNGSDAYGVYFRDSTGNLVSDSIVNASKAGVADVYVRGAGVNNLTNCSFNKSDTTFYSGATGNINVFWYVDGRVTDNNGVALNGAVINASDVNGTSVFNATTNSTGWIPTQTVLEYFRNITGIYNATPHWFNASTNFYGVSYSANNSQSVVSGNAVVSRALSWARSVNLSSPLNGVVSSDYAQYFCFVPNSVFAFVNASLLVGGVVVAGNSSELVNASSNCVYYVFSRPGIYSWSVLVYDSAGSVESSSYSLEITNPFAGGGGGSTPTPTAVLTPTATSTATPTAAPTLIVVPSVVSTLMPSSSPSVQPSVVGFSVSGKEEDVVPRISVVQELIRVAQSQNKDVREAERLLELAQQALQRGDYASASAYVRQADAALKGVGVVSNGVSSAGFDWVVVAGGVVVLLFLAGAAYWLYSRKRKKEL